MSAPKSVLYRVTIVLTSPLWVFALVIGAICGTLVTGFMGGFLYVTTDAWDKKK